MRLRPERVILPDGTRCQLRAQVLATPGTHTRVVRKAPSLPARAFAAIRLNTALSSPAGDHRRVHCRPVGAVAGGAVGAGVVTTHLLVNHPQATLEPGSVIDFTLTDTLSLTPAVAPGN